jgi:hypothetical protein
MISFFKKNCPSPGAMIVLLILTLGCLAVGGLLRAYEAPEWMAPDPSQHPPGLRPWAVEADCYSQLARVQRILRGQGLIQNHFTVENWPEGLTPSTTATFDYAILLLYAPLALVTSHPLDWAGALISPALWLGLVLFWFFFRSRAFNLAGRALFVLGSASLPQIIWATAFGRPRHQSLILALLALGLTAEYERWHPDATPESKRAWNIFAGIVWGLACWTSLYEPVAAVAVLIGFNLIVRRRENPVFLVSFGTVMLVALVLEGVHVFNIYSLSPEYYGYLMNWFGTIAEMRGFSIATIRDFFQDMTLVVMLLPVIAWRLWLGAAKADKTDRMLIILTGLLVVFGFMQSRWLYYATLGELFLIVRYVQTAPTRWTRLAVLAVLLAGLADSDHTVWERHFEETPVNQPSAQLAVIASSIDQPGGIMAPWWLSPGLLYFSGQPIVSGSSHCGMTGIADSAKFFAATSWVDAEEILHERKVHWIVVYDDQNIYNGEQEVYPLLNNSRQILGLPAYGGDEEDKGPIESTVAQILIEDRFVPLSFHLRAVTPQLKLYEYVPGST